MRTDGMVGALGLTFIDGTRWADGITAEGK